MNRVKFYKERKEYKTIPDLLEEQIRKLETKLTTHSNSQLY
jgi:hypothetical protein